jgi:hypothetical protein
MMLLAATAGCDWGSAKQIDAENHFLGEMENHYPRAFEKFEEWPRRRKANLEERLSEAMRLIKEEAGDGDAS